MNIIKLVVEQPDYETGDYGVLECEPKSIKVTVIRLYRSITQQGLRDCKITCEENWGQGEYAKITGRVKMTIFADDAALGRLYKLVHWYENDINNGSVVKIESIEDLGTSVVGVSS